MKNYSDLDSNGKGQLIGHIDRRWRQLNELEKDWGERVWKYLFLTNSGGAIATLSFLGTVTKPPNSEAIKIALLFFVLGVFLAGVATVKIFHHMSHMLKEYKSGVEHFYNDKISWEHLCEEDGKRAKVGCLDYVIPYASFAAFLGGCVAGAIALFS